MWVIYALLSAIFASFTTIFVKMGIKNINSNLATAIRTVVVLIMAWFIVFLTGRQKEIMTLTKSNWMFLILSGLATGFSWMFYYKALQIGEASRVAPIDKMSVVFTMILAFVILQESLDVKKLIGGAFIALGTLFMIF
ncbi:MAG TPA: EamA family transporter [Clostridiales bacterium]|nr:EamA family transporter [Clostridiales bacterium]